MMDTTTTSAEVLGFWFSARVRALWFNSNPAFDAEIRERFEGLWRAAAAGELDHWEASADGALALAIVLDQFPLNMYRGEALGFSTEQAACEVAERAIGRGFDSALGEAQKHFLYLPFMHSEKLHEQDRAVALYRAAGMGDALRWAKHHREIVRRFGRFPHRNAALGRACTEEECAYLDAKGSFHG